MQATNPEHFLRHVLFLLGFTLIEYLRSGRVLIEGAATVAFYLVFLRGGEAGVSAEQFFTRVGIFTLVLAIYTMSNMAGLGDRPQGYVLLSRRMGRPEYLLGLYASGLVVLLSSYGLLSLATAGISRFADLSPLDWLLGTLPLTLNIGLLGALVMMLSPLVLSASWRLFVLGMIALAFSGNFWGRAALDSLWPIVRTLLDSLQTILSWPMVPAFSGFTLAVSRDYSGSAPAILIAQAALIVVLLSLAIHIFLRRELILSGE